VCTCVCVCVCVCVLCRGREKEREIMGIMRALREKVGILSKHMCLYERETAFMRVSM
jgi:hypothetical protein